MEDHLTEQRHWELWEEAVGEKSGSLDEAEEEAALEVPGFGWEVAAARAPFVPLGKEAEH